MPTINKEITHQQCLKILEITCPIDVAGMKPKHGMVHCTHESHKFDTACFTQCQQGYTLDTLAFSFCQSNSSWSKILPDCKGLDFCFKHFKNIF